jgi:hypothetical protein
LAPSAAKVRVASSPEQLIDTTSKLARIDKFVLQLALGRIARCDNTMNIWRFTKGSGNLKTNPCTCNTDYCFCSDAIRLLQISSKFHYTCITSSDNSKLGRRN